MKTVKIVRCPICLALRTVRSIDALAMPGLVVCAPCFARDTAARVEQAADTARDAAG